MKSEVCQRIASGIGQVLECDDLDGYTRVRTPFSYPDGSVIDLFVRDVDGVTTVTDLGETSRWLELNALSEKRTAKQHFLIDCVSRSLGVDIFKGMIEVTTSPALLAEAFTRVAQAAVRVGDISFTFRTRVTGAVADDVEDFLVDRQIENARNATRVGDSGKLWRVDFETRAVQRKALIQVMSTANRGAVSRLTDHAVSAWVDLQPVITDHSFISLFDDTVDVWKPEDYKQLERFSVVAFWSQPDALMEQLAAWEPRPRPTAWVKSSPAATAARYR